MKRLVITAALLLLMASLVFAGVEDFTDYTEDDFEGYFTESSTKVDFTQLPRNANHHDVYYDHGAGHFGDFEWLYEVYLSSSNMGADNSAECCIGASANVEAFPGLWDGVVGSVSGRTGGGGEYVMWLKEAEDGSQGDVDPWWSVSVNTLYYCTLERSGTTGTLKIYSDSGRTNLLDTLSITCINDTLRYSIIAPYYESSDAGDSSITGYFQDLDLQEAGESSIIPQVIHHLKQVGGL